MLRRAPMVDHTPPVCGEGGTSYRVPSTPRPSLLRLLCFRILCLIWLLSSFLFFFLSVELLAAVLQDLQVDLRGLLVDGVAADGFFVPEALGDFCHANALNREN